MKLALIGYGKMGKRIEAIALERGHRVVLKVNRENAMTFTDKELSGVDVAIEFSLPQSAVENMMRCFRCNVPVVVGTTGWSDHLDEIKKSCSKHDGALFYASNFSPGVNLFFALNEKLAALMNRQPEYKVALEEIHHIHKVDAPSGTALTLAHELIAGINRIDRIGTYTDKLPPHISAGELPVVSKRRGEVPGTHIISYTSPVDSITIMHEAFNRDGFALGAVLAAEWVAGKKGVFGMKDMLK